MEGWDWLDKHEEKVKEEKSKSYFDIVEGKQQFVLLSHCAPLAQVWTGTKYRPAEEGDKNVSIKGVCWVLQQDDAEGGGKEWNIKQAKLPYTIVKSIRELLQDPEWGNTIPFPHLLTLTAKNAKSKEVEYSLTPSPKVIDIPQRVMDELAKKLKPEEIVERIKGNIPAAQQTESKAPHYPTPEEEGIDLDQQVF